GYKARLTYVKAKDAICKELFEEQENFGLESKSIIMEFLDSI
ncbi:1151_t:CDS:2, partial [Gigaspora margarita]